jgi:hypothetical protein
MACVNPNNWHAQGGDGRDSADAQHDRAANQAPPQPQMLALA